MPSSAVRCRFNFLRNCQIFRVAVPLTFPPAVGKNPVSQHLVILAFFILAILVDI